MTEVHFSVRLQVIAASPDVSGMQTIRTETVTSLDSPGNDSGRGSCEEYIDQIQRDQRQTDRIPRSNEPLQVMGNVMHNYKSTFAIMAV